MSRNSSILPYPPLPLILLGIKYWCLPVVRSTIKAYQRRNPIKRRPSLGGYFQGSGVLLARDVLVTVGVYVAVGKSLLGVLDGQGVGDGHGVLSALHALHAPM